jgi:lysophospholipase L1-like esterase
MHSSTSNSDHGVPQGKLDTSTVVLLGTILTLLGGIEGIARVGFDHTSRVQQRQLSQREALLTVADSAKDESAHIAVVGNSLLVEGLDVPLFKDRIGPRFVPAPYFVLATNYYDWFYALKRLFAEGIRPRYVLLALSPNQFASSRIRGDYSARYLFQQSDLLDIARQTHMDTTTAAGFFLAHVSEYYSTRDVTRGFVLTRVLPSVAELRNRLEADRAPTIEEETLSQLAAERLPMLEQLCQANGARFMLVIPPTYQKGARTIAQVGEQRHIPVLVPVANSELDASDYDKDGFHLNRKGAQIFTTRLAAAILGTLQRRQESAADVHQIFRGPG